MATGTQPRAILGSALVRWVAIVWVTAAAFSQTARADLLFEVRNPEGPARLWVLASVSFPHEEPLRFDRGVLEAFESAETLLLPNSAVLSPQNALIGGKAHLGDVEKLRDRLPPDVMAGFAEAVGRAGYPPTFAEVTAPWFAARMVRYADRKRTAFADESEFERYFVHLAGERAEPKEIVALEESAVSYDRLVALSHALQVEVMERAILDSAHASQDLPAAHAAWTSGDAEALAKVLLRSDAEHPELRASLEKTRLAENERLASACAERLGQPGTGGAFLVADARNVLGDEGVLRRLAARGLEVRPVPAAGVAGQPFPAPPLAEPPGPRAGERHRVLLIGIDGATLRVTDPLIAAGRLPNLAALARAGVAGPLRSHRPIYSPRVWNSIATGKTPAKHGIEGFTYRDDEGKQHLYLGSHRKAHALWNIASKAGLTVGVVNWWNTYPPEVVNGVLISDHAKPTRLAELRRLTGAGGLGGEEGATAYPLEWQPRVAEVYAQRLVVPGVGDPFLGNVGLTDWMKKEELSKRFRDDAAAARIGLDVQSQLDPDLLMVFLAGIDRVSHRLWGALEPPDVYDPPLDMSETQRHVARAALEAYYEYTDHLIGRLLAGTGPNDLVLVVSDHGFEAGEHLGDLTGVHEGEAAIDGVVFARGPGIAAGQRAAGMSVNDVSPTILAWLGLPLGQDMDGKVAAFLAPSRPVRSIATHDVGEVERIGGSASGSEEEILDQLRALGYIE